MEDNMNKTNNPDAGEKTFTQDDVNRIIGERLAKEKSKGDQDFSKREQELQQREIKLTAKEMLNDKGLSVQLVDALNCTSKETLEKSISVIEQVFNENKKENTKFKIKGAKPGESGNEPQDKPTDAAIRKAMGFSK